MASRMCAEFCRRPFGKETVREVIDPTAWGDCSRGPRWLVLARNPIVEIGSLVEGEDEPLVLDTDYIVDKEHGMILRGTIDAPRGWRTGKLTVEYTAGYELLDGVPWSYERACLILLRGLWFSHGRDPSVRSIDIPDVGSRTYAASGDSSLTGAFPLEVRQLLQPHRRIV